LATIFPASPAVNDTFKSDGTTWKWNGSAWTFFSGVGTVGGGGDATVAFQVDQPDTASLDAGALWIDSDEDAISGLLPATFTRWISVLSASATTLSGLDDNALSLIYTAGYEKVFINGTLLVRGSDYTATTGNTIVLTTAAESGDAVEVHSYESFQIADTYTQAAADAKFFAIDESRIDRWTKTYSASATTITGVDDYSESLLYTSGLESLYINGVLVDPSEYTRTSASVITPDEAIVSGDVVDLIIPKAFEVANTYTIAQIDAKYNTRTRWTKTFSASATVISGVDDNSLSLLYTAGYEEVYLNGILLTPITDYARTSASVVTLGSAVVTNDIIEIVNTQPFNVADTYTTTQADNLFIPDSTIDAKGDLLVGTADNTVGRLAVGTNNQLLAADSSTASGLKWVNPGMTLINTTSFTTQSSQALPAGTFTSTYKNYKIIWRHTQNTSNGSMTVRMRASGTNATGSDYSLFGSYSGYSAGPTRVNQTSGTSFGLVSPNASNIAVIVIDITGPQVANQTIGFARVYSTSAGDDVLLSMQHGLATSYDSMDFIISAGTMTGQVSVYGYNE
jgi:hypothetical protein